jgi:hypothetical protein
MVLQLRDRPVDNSIDHGKTVHEVWTSSDPSYSPRAHARVRGKGSAHSSARDFFFWFTKWPNHCLTVNSVKVGSGAKVRAATS